MVLGGCYIRHGDTSTLWQVSAAAQTNYVLAAGNTALCVVATAAGGSGGTTNSQFSLAPLTGSVEGAVSPHLLWDSSTAPQQLALDNGKETCAGDTGGLGLAPCSDQRTKGWKARPSTDGQ